MIYFLALIPATGLTVAGYIVLYLSGRMEGGLKTFGKYLSFWAFTLAALVILGAIFAASHHHRRGEFGMRGGHHRMQGWPGPRPFGPRFFGPWRDRGPDGERRPPPPDAGAPAAAPAAPAATPPAAPSKTP